MFRFAVGAITDVVDDIFRDTGYGAADIDWLVPHQANKRIIDGAVHKLGIAPEKVVMTLDRHGNTSAASIPLALTDAVTDRRIKRGDLVLLESMGGGFTWGLLWCAGESPASVYSGLIAPSVELGQPMGFLAFRISFLLRSSCSPRLRRRRRP